MTNPVRHRSRRRRTVAVAVLLVVALAGLYGALTAQLMSAGAAATAVIASERRGVSYLRPATQLIGELTRARSAAVRGGTPDLTALTAATRAMIEADDQHGDALRTRQRWADLRAEIARLTSDRPTGQAALERYGDAVALATELVRTVGATSQLVVDPDLYRHYLAHTTLLRLPTVLTAANLTADQLALGSRSADANREPAGSAMSVIQAQAAAAADAVDAGLRDVRDAAGVTVHRDLAGPLDAFREATGRLVGPDVLALSRPPIGAADAAVTAGQVRDASLALANAMLAELDTLLSARSDALAQQRIYHLALAVAGVVLGLVLLFRAVPAHEGDAAEATTDGSGPTGPADVASVSITLPEVDARDLLSLEELVHIGRGVQARPKDEANDAP